MGFTFGELVARRRMVRAFDGQPIAEDDLEAVLTAAVRAPSAGFCQGISLVTLQGAQTSDYWNTTLPLSRRATFPWPRLLVAPVLVVVAADPSAYTARYDESDKAHTGLGQGADAWPQPMWFIDAGMAALALLYAAIDRNLGACFFGVFEHEAALKAKLAIPNSVRLAGTVALGHPDLEHDRPSRSARRARRDNVIRRGGWG